MGLVDHLFGGVLWPEETSRTFRPASFPTLDEEIILGRIVIGGGACFEQLRLTVNILVLSLRLVLISQSNSRLDKTARRDH